MKGQEFIRMMRQDIETHEDKEMLSQVVDAMEAVVQSKPFAEYPATGKTAEDCFKKMEDNARKNQSNQKYCFTPSATLDFIAKYLLGETASVAAPAAGSGGIIDLDDLL
jgi:hypothetical protein